MKESEINDLINENILSGGGRTKADKTREVFNEIAGSYINKDDSPEFIEAPLTTGTNTYTASFTEPITAYKEGVIYKIKFASVNTGASTINIDSIAVKAIKKNDGSDVSAGDLTGIVALVYNGSVFQVLGGVSAGGGATINDSTPSTSTVYSSSKTEDLVNDLGDSVQLALNNKVDKVTGKGLSTEDYTTAEKTKLSGIAANAIALTALSASSPLSYNNTTGAFTIQQANGSQNGYISSADWSTFNNKANSSHTHAIADITNLQSTLDAKAVKTGTNFIYLDADFLKYNSASGASSAEYSERNGTNTTGNVWLFDAVTEESIQFKIYIDSNFSTDFKFKVIWSASGATVSNGVVWGLALALVGDGDSVDATFSTEVTVTDSVIGATDYNHITTLSGVVTPSGTVAGDKILYGKLTRRSANGSDTMSVDARLSGFVLQYTRSDI